jgi:hypothetical protein
MELYVLVYKIAAKLAGHLDHPARSQTVSPWATYLRCSASEREASCSRVPAGTDSRAVDLDVGWRSAIAGERWRPAVGIEGLFGILQQQAAGYGVEILGLICS